MKLDFDNQIQFEELEDRLEMEGGSCERKCSGGDGGDGGDTGGDGGKGPTTDVEVQP